MNARNFDPIDFIRSNIHSEEAQKSIFRSMSWYIDMALINEVRSLFFKIFTDLKDGGSFQDYDEFLASMTVEEAREANLVEQGFNNSGSILTMRMLTILREDWHDAAYINQRHEKLSIPVLIRSEKVQVPSIMSKTKLRAIAEDECDGETAEAVTEFYNDLLLRETTLADQRFESAKARVPVLVHMYEFIENTSILQTADFCDLPTAVRHRLVTGMKKVVGDAMLALATNRKVSVLEFAGARKELRLAIAQLDVLLASALCDDDAVDTTPCSGGHSAGRDWNAASDNKRLMHAAIIDARNSH